MWAPDAGPRVGLALLQPAAVAGSGNHTPLRPIIQSNCTMNNEPKLLSTGQGQVSPLLSLPGELRNRIYDFCTEDGAVNPASQSHFGNLRYVCQFLYLEFSPLYLARTAVVLQIGDVERYLSVFYPGLCSPETITPDCTTTPGLTRASTSLGRIRIDVPFGATIDLSSFASLKPNKLQFALVRGSCTNRPLQQASDVLQRIVDSSCSTPFRQVIERFLFRYSFTPEIVFKLRRGITIPPPDPTTPFTSIFQHPSWLRQHGLPLLYSLKIVVESSKGVLRMPGTNGPRRRHARGLMQVRPLDELDGRDSQEAFVSAQLADLDLSHPSIKPDSLSRLGTH